MNFITTADKTKLYCRSAFSAWFAVSNRVLQAMIDAIATPSRLTQLQAGNELRRIGW